MMNARLFRMYGSLIPYFALVVLTACGAARPSGSPAVSPRTILEVDNRGFADMTVYVVESSRRIRLGTATGNSTTKLMIPVSLVGGGRELQFLCDPIGGNRPAVSERLFVWPGEQVKLTILR